MTDIELEKIKTHIRTYLAAGFCADGSPWLDHNVRMFTMLIDKEREACENAGRVFDLDSYLANAHKPDSKIKKRR